jgi:hypothetical protein
LAVAAPSPALSAALHGRRWTNPLGARALYLGKRAYPIHGTNQPSTIGTFVSSGCIRLTNEDVIDLHHRIQVGTLRAIAGQAIANALYNNARHKSGGARRFVTFGVRPHDAGTHAYVCKLPNNFIQGGL